VLKQHAAQIAASFLTQAKNEAESDQEPHSRKGACGFTKADAGVVKDLLEVINRRIRPSFPLEFSMRSARARFQRQRGLSRTSVS